MTTEGRRRQGGAWSVSLRPRALDRPRRGGEAWLVRAGAEPLWKIHTPSATLGGPTAHGKGEVRLVGRTAIHAPRCGDRAGTKLSPLCKSPPQPLGPVLCGDRGGRVCFLAGHHLLGGGGGVVPEQRGGSSPPAPRCPPAPMDEGRAGQSSGCGLALSPPCPRVETARGLHREVSPPLQGDATGSRVSAAAGPCRGLGLGEEFPFAPRSFSLARPTRPPRPWPPLAPPPRTPSPNGSASVQEALPAASSQPPPPPPCISWALGAKASPAGGAQGCSCLCCSRSPAAAPLSSAAPPTCHSLPGRDSQVSILSPLLSATSSSSNPLPPLS